MGSVHIALQNGSLGTTAATADGIAGLVLTGYSEGSYTTGTPLLLTSLNSLLTAGITEENNSMAYRQVRDFYTEAGNGSPLYLLLVSTATTLSQIALATNAEGAAKLLEYAQGAIKLLGIATTDSAVASATETTTVTTHGINEEVHTAAANMAVLANNYFLLHKPFRAIIGGTSYTGVPGSLTDLTAGTTNHRTAICIGDTEAGERACLGLIIGRLAAQPVMRKISRVRTGPINTATAYLGNDALAAVAESAPLIAGKGYITWCQYPNVAGYYLSGDGTCASPQSDYYFLARGRVIDKVHRLAYAAFVQAIDDEVPVNDDGTLDAGYCQWLSLQIVNPVNSLMVAQKELSGIECSIDPAQNVLSTNRLDVVLRILPLGYATDIYIQLGFTNPNNG